jgi:hypothetical protein
MIVSMVIVGRAEPDTQADNGDPATSQAMEPAAEIVSAWPGLTKMTSPRPAVHWPMA